MVARRGVKYALEPSPKTMGTFAVEIVANRAPRRGGAYEMSVSFCLSEPMETAQSIVGCHTCSGCTAHRAPEHRIRHITSREEERERVFFVL